MRLPILGWVKLREELRFSGKALSATVRRVADRWFVSVPVEVDMPEAVRESQAAVGIDLGVSTAATLSSGKKLLVQPGFVLQLAAELTTGTLTRRESAPLCPGWASCARINACEEEGSGVGLTASVKPASRMRESAMSLLGMD